MDCHAGSTKGFVSNPRLLWGKKLTESYDDYNDDMNGDVFENWFENTLLKNLSEDRKVLKVMDNTTYHSRLPEETPTMNMKKTMWFYLWQNIILKYHLHFQSNPCCNRKPMKLIFQRNLSLTRWPPQLVTLFFVCYPIIAYLTQ